MKHNTYQCQSLIFVNQRRQYHQLKQTLQGNETSFNFLTRWICQLLQLLSFHFNERRLMLACFFLSSTLFHDEVDSINGSNTPGKFMFMNQNRNKKKLSWHECVVHPFFVSLLFVHQINVIINKKKCFWHVVGGVIFLLNLKEKARKPFPRSRIGS